MKQMSLKTLCKKVNLSNGAHKRCSKIAQKRNGPSCKSARYHQNVIRIQNYQCRLLTKAERKSIYERS